MVSRSGGNGDATIIHNTSDAIYSDNDNFSLHFLIFSLLSPPSTNANFSVMCSDSRFVCKLYSVQNCTQPIPLLACSVPVSRCSETRSLGFAGFCVFGSFCLFLVWDSRLPLNLLRAANGRNEVTVLAREGRRGSGEWGFGGYFIRPLEIWLTAKRRRREGGRKLLCCRSGSKSDYTSKNDENDCPFSSLLFSLHYLVSGSWFRLFRGQALRDFKIFGKKKGKMDRDE